MHLHELIVQSRIGYRCEMKNGVELFVTELVVPIQSRQILRNEVAAISREILEIAGTKIVDHRQTRIRKFFLQRQCKIGADETGSASDDEIGRRVQFLGTRIGER